MHESVTTGEEYMVAHNDVPVGELRPVRRSFVRRAVLLEAMRSAPSIDVNRFRSDLDAVIDQTIEPRADPTGTKR
jgi:antitoxin (DNA-binding transcriptional repressor) of toxin-antitoxin stability system